MCHIFFVSIFCFFTSLFAGEPSVLYLTWRGDPSTTMTIIWHSATGEGKTDVSYMTRGDSLWKKTLGTRERLVRSSVDVHKVELTDLLPDREYLFRINEGAIYKFKTLPDTLEKPLRVAMGGDGYFRKETFSKMNKLVASKSPDFVILVGDIAYTEGLRRALKTRYWKVNRWQEFFQLWTQDMMTEDRRLIPIVPGIGNHDVLTGFDHPEKKDVLFYQLFAFPMPNIPYRTLKIADKICFYVLDTGHTYPIGGRQTEWLKEVLMENQKMAYQIPTYHIPGYPSHSSFSFRESVDIRKFWSPLFEEYGVKVSVENDNHTFKRTLPLKEGAINQKEGIYYLGDGSWGVVPETPRKRWYLAKARKVNSVWMATFTEENAHFEAFDLEGNTIDELFISPSK